MNKTYNVLENMKNIKGAGKGFCKINILGMRSHNKRKIKGWGKKYEQFYFFRQHVGFMDSIGGECSLSNLSGTEV